MAQKISKTFSNIGENIRKIRQAKKISQADFAKLFDLARPSVGAYEEGRSEPKIETLIQIAKHFRISIDILLTRKLTVSEIYSFDLVNRKLDKVHQQAPKPQNEPGTGSLLVPADSYLEYIVNHKNNSYLSEMKQIHLPSAVPGESRTFEMRGSEMEYQQQGIHHGDLVLGVSLSDRELKQLGNEVIAVVHHQDITIKRLKSVTKTEIVMSSDDPNYPEVTISRKDILEKWKFMGVYTTKLKPPTPLEQRMSRIEEELKRLGKGS